MVPTRAIIRVGILACGALGLALFQETEEPAGFPAPAPAPASRFRPALLDNHEGNGCVECHSEVTTEWASSAHGVAWIDEVYQAAIAKKRRPKSCYACHIPAPLLAAGLVKRVTPRTTNQHLGVSCESCHLGPDGVMLGPRGTDVEGHASQLSEYMTAPGSNQLCSACHAKSIGPVIGIAKDFIERGQPERGLSCVGCHMSPVERRWADGEGVPLRIGRSHALQTPRDPAFLERAFGTSWERDGLRSRIRLRNQAGHRIPGLTNRAFLFRATLLDADGNELDSEELRIDSEFYLPLDSTTDLELELAPGGVRVHLLGRHEDPLLDEPITFLDLLLETAD